MGLLSAIFGGWSNNESAKLQREQLELQKQQIAMQLEQNKRTNRYSALDTSSQRTLNSYGEGANIDYYMNAYNAQMNMANTQIASQYGSTVAHSATTGFRNNGSNSSLSNNAGSVGKFQYQSTVGQAKAQLSQSGLNSMMRQSQFDSTLNNYTLNIQNAMETANANIQMADLRIDQLQIADNYWGSSRMWSDLFTGAVQTAESIGSMYIGYKLMPKKQN